MDEQVFVIWKDSYSVGNKVIDEQHKRMIDLINAFYSMVKSSYDYQSALGKIDELIVYGKRHFNFEESFLEKHDYEDLENHLKYHRFYQNKVDLLRAEFKLTEGENLDEIFAFLKDWWLSHVAKVDKEYSKNIS